MGAEVFDFWVRIGLALSQIIGTEVPVNPRFMVFFDFEFSKMGCHKMLLANLLTDASLLMIKMWKSEAVPSFDD